MKAISITLHFLTILAVVFLFFRETAASEGGTLTANTTTEHAAEKLPIVGEIMYVNTDTLWSSYKLVVDMLDELAAEKLIKEGQYSQEIKRFEQEVKEFQQKAATMTPTQGQQREAELQLKQQEIMQLEQNLQQELLESEQQKNKVIQEKITTFLREYSQENGFRFIFGYSIMSNLLYAPDSLDITTQVVRELNVKYAKLNSKKE